ncbi:MAG TPA: hypothetical protein VGG68_02105 [Caulobacteraceae bacterium]
MNKWLARAAAPPQCLTMARVRYLGVSDPAAVFETFRPYRERLIELELRCAPFGTEYLILNAAKAALDAAAHYFTGDPVFYASKPEQSSWRPNRGSQ